MNDHIKADKPKYMEIQYCHFDFWREALWADGDFDLYIMGGEL